MMTLEQLAARLLDVAEYNNQHDMAHLNRLPVLISLGKETEDGPDRYATIAGTAFGLLLNRPHVFVCDRHPSELRPDAASLVLVVRRKNG